jgi:hypothetical protein
MAVREMQPPPMMVREAPPPMIVREAPPPPVMMREAPAPVAPTVSEKRHCRQGDQFWMKACLVFCMLLLVIIVFQLNRTNRLLSKK